MNKSFREEISAREKLVDEMLRQAEEKINSFPDGRINVKRRKGKTYYYLAGTNEGEKLLTQNDRSLITDLAQKSYLKKVLKASKKESEAIRQLKKHYPEKVAEEVYDALTDDRRKLVKRIGLADEQYVRKWEKKTYTPKEFKEGMPVFMTMKGERVRSKSEMIIADRLFLNGIPYKYECPLKVGDEIIHPDFSILKISERKVVYHEHCGRMDDPSYLEDMVPRVNKYILAGMHLGDKLFLSFESSASPLDVRVIDEMINRHFR